MKAVFYITRSITLAMIMLNSAIIASSSVPVVIRIGCVLVIAGQIWNQTSFEAKMRKRIAEVQAQQAQEQKGEDV